MKNNHATLKDIAQQLGITVATVSRALKNYPDISPSTKKAVLELAEKLKYRPNPIALNLRNSRSYVIGVVVPEIVHYFFSSVISGIMDVADEIGYSVMLCQTNESYPREVRETTLLLNSRVDGLLISLSDGTSSFEHLHEFLEHNIPLVMFDKICDEISVTKVIVDDYAGAFEAVEHLILQGKKRIALIRGPLISTTNKLRAQGYVDALKKYDLPVQDEYIMESSSGATLEEGSRISVLLMQLPEPPDAIFSVADAAAIGALNTVKKLGKKIPEDVAIVGFSNWEMASVVEPPLSSVYQPGYEMGQVSAKLLLEQIEAKQNNTEVQPVTHVLPTRLIIRESSAIATVPLESL